MALASNIALVTIYGQFVDYQGSAVAGQIKFTMSKTLLNSLADQIVVPSTITKTLDDTGSFSVTLPATDDPQFSEIFTYLVEESFTGGRSYSISLPAINNVIRTNLVTNPSFESDTAGWDGVNGSVIQTYAAAYLRGTYFQYASGLFTASSTATAGIQSNPRYAVTSGSSYTFSGYVQDVDSGAPMTASISWYSALTGGSAISTVSGTSTSINVNGFTRISVIGTAPVGANYAVVSITGSMTSSKKVYLDAIMLEQASTLKTYFDGHSTANVGASPYWTGVANNSVSVYPDYGGSLAYTAFSPASTVSPVYDNFVGQGQWSILNSTLQTADAGWDQSLGVVYLFNPIYQQLQQKTYSALTSYTYAGILAGQVTVTTSEINSYLTLVQAQQSAAESSLASAQVSLASIVSEFGSRLDPFFVSGA